MGSILNLISLKKLLILMTQYLLNTVNNQDINKTNFMTVNQK